MFLLGQYRGGGVVGLAKRCASTVSHQDMAILPGGSQMCSLLEKVAWFPPVPG